MVMYSSDLDHLDDHLVVMVIQMVLFHLDHEPSDDPGWIQKIFRARRTECSHDCLQSCLDATTEHCPGAN